MVLLKNDGILPLKPDAKILVVGPMADQTKVLLGNYNGTPSQTATILEGLKKEFAGAQVNFVAGTQFLSHDADPVPASALKYDGKPGVKATYTKLDMTNINHPEAMKALATARRAEHRHGRADRCPSEASGVKPLAIHWETTITAPDTGDYNLGLKANAFFRIQLDGKSVTSSYGGSADEAKLGRVHLEAGKPATLAVECASFSGGQPHARLVWSKVDLAPAARGHCRCEEGRCRDRRGGHHQRTRRRRDAGERAGFMGGDRTSIDLPQPEQDLLEAMAATRKPLVVVLTNGSALAVNWAKEHANAILDAWYPGEEGGAAVAETLRGKNNPAGRLPVTFYTGVDQLPHFEDYAMKGRTYRYFHGKPLYPFGYGLSYTTFTYSGLTLPTEAVKPAIQ